MRDPYEVLGVNKNASMDDIKAAYKELVKKYHPDKYQNNPLSGLAEEKMQEINEAYDYLTKNHSSGSGFGGSNNGYNKSGEPSPELQQIRQMMNTGNLRGAEAALNRCTIRNAEWYYLCGMLSFNKGWYDDAINKMQTAVSMEPSNIEYRQGLNTVMGSGGMYRNASYGQGYNSRDDLACKLCQAYICMDCLCDCI